MWIKVYWELKSTSGTEDTFEWGWHQPNKQIVQLLKIKWNVLLLVKQCVKWNFYCHPGMSFAFVQFTSKCWNLPQESFILYGKWNLIWNEFDEIVCLSLESFIKHNYTFYWVVWCPLCLDVSFVPVMRLKLTQYSFQWVKGSFKL